MKLKWDLLAILFSLSSGANAQVGEVTSLFVQDSLKLISSNFKFTEGASVDKIGNVFFTDQPNDQIWKYGVDGKLSLFLAKSGRANGTYFDKRGNLIICADEDNEIRSVNPQGKVTLVFKNTIGAALNGPNDLWIDKSGGIYFTDPYYQRNYWVRQVPEIKGEKLYYLAKGSRELLTMDSSLVRPNGIVGSPDGKRLYVADALARKVYQYDIDKAGSLANKKVLLTQGSDGMTLDEHGNIYLTGRNGVDIYSAKGDHFGNIRIPEPHTSNLCFGGRNRDILFITASKSIYILPMKVSGVE
ncbi:MAG: SMP-30/gluconolactonase/LRE family protein [Bacteroidia bacterium]